MSASDPIQLGPFDLLRPIGRGGMADVWEGLHRTQKVPVAVKVITGQIAREARFREAFSREVQAVARLAHPGVVMVFEAGTVPEATAEASDKRLAYGAPYLAMELASWGSLDQVDLPLRWHDLYPILMAILDALAHAHARGVVHRDLKPGNVLMAAPWDARPGVKLTDFGIAHALEAEDAKPEQYAASGTPMFMAPEQFMGRWRDYGPWTDLYAMGGLTYALATGKPPFKGKNLAQLAYDHMSRPPPTFEEDSPLPPELEAWIGRLMQKAPEDRFQRAADAAWALAQIWNARRGSRAAPSAAPRLEAAADAVSVEAPTQVGPQAVVAAPMEDEETEASEGTAPRPSIASAPRPAARAFVPTEFDDTQRTLQSLGAAVPTHFREARPAELATVVHATQLEEAAPWGEAEAPPRPSSQPRLPPRAPPPLPESWARSDEHGPSIRLVGAGLSLFGLRTVPLVDRAPERDRLWAALGEVRASGRARAVVLRGQAGHGKSRVVEWIAERADEVGSAHVLRATHGPTPGPSDGLGRMVARHLCSVNLAGADLLERNRAQLAAAGVEDEYEARALAELMRPAEGADKRVRFADATERHNLVRRVLARVARDRPVIVWLEDVQWGADALAFAAHVLAAQSTAAQPILLLATARDDLLSERPLERELLEVLLQRPEAEAHTVAPLAPEDQNQLVQELLMLDEGLAAQVVRRTGGNPLFAIQLVGDWVERGVLEIAEHGFALQPGEAAELPDDIHQVWNKRIERVLAPLPPAARRTLEIAAILSQTTDAGEWQDACHEAGLSVPPLLVIALMENRLIMPADGGWSFAHGMLRESLERSALESGRAARHHAACARMLVRRYGRDAPGVPERLGAHYLAAGEAELALEPLRRGVRQLLQTSEFPQALELVRIRDAALDRLGADAEDPRRATGWVLRARVWALMGRFEAATEEARRAEEAARRLGWRRVLPDALAALAGIAHERGDQGAALNAFDEARRLYTGLGDRHGVARCLVGRGEAVYRLGDLPRAERFLSEGLGLFEADRDDAGVAKALHRLGIVALWRGEPDRARALLKRQLDLLEGIGDRFQTARCIAALGELARQIGDLDEAERAYEKALQIDEAIGSRNAWMERLNLGLVRLARRDFERAGVLSARVAEDLGPDAEPSRRCAVLIQRLPSLAAAEDWATWDAALDEARARLDETGLTEGDVAWLLQLAGELAAERGRPTRARAALKLAARQWRALGRPEKVEEVERALQRAASGP